MKKTLVALAVAALAATSDTSATTCCFCSSVNAIVDSLILSIALTLQALKTEVFKPLKVR